MLESVTNRKPLRSPDSHKLVILNPPSQLLNLPLSLSLQLPTLVFSAPFILFLTFTDTSFKSLVLVVLSKVSFASHSTYNSTAPRARLLTALREFVDNDAICSLPAVLQSLKRAGYIEDVSVISGSNHWEAASSSLWDAKSDTRTILRDRAFHGHTTTDQVNNNSDTLWVSLA